MNCVDVTVEGLEEPSWIPKVPRFCEKILEKLSLDNWEVSIVFCTNEFIRELNNRFRGKDEPTDVLSFSQNEGAKDFPIVPDGYDLVGDIVISLEMLRDTVSEFSIEPDEELKRLIIHGFLHLAGYNHNDNSPERPMLVLQEKILQGFAEEKIF
jgi:probable rRNA maturation factor